MLLLEGDGAVIETAPFAFLISHFCGYLLLITGGPISLYQLRVTARLSRSASVDEDPVLLDY